MTVMFDDIHNDLDSKIRSGRIDHINFMEILYADDTLLITKNAKAMNKLIAGIELESGYYNMKLNKGNCEVIAMNCNSNIHFSEDARLKLVSEAKYLGGNITRAADSRTEVEA